MTSQLPPNFLQSAAWAKTNQLVGHTVIRQKFGGYTNYLIVKSAKRARYLEIPGGPLLDWSDSTAVTAAFNQICQIATEHKCAFIRFRPQLLNTAKNRKLIAITGAQKAPMHLHAEHTVIIDLTPSAETLLKNMRRQTRYEVRRAAKLNLTVNHGNSEDLFREFYAAQAQTAARQHFVPPTLETLLAERTAFGQNAQIYVAKLSRQEQGLPARSDDSAAPIAYGLILISGTEAAYFEAASTDLNRKLPGAYALQWQIMQDLKQQGIKRYNLWGIAPPGAKNHRYAGVTTFKTGFGGEVIEFIPAQDIVLSKLKYTLDFAIETARKKRRNL